MSQGTQAMHALEARFAERVIAVRWPILVIAPILIAIAASGVRFLELSSDYRVYFDDDNPQLLAFEALENTYAKGGNVFFAIVSDDGDATSERALDATAWLTEHAWQTPYSTRVDSLTNFQHTTADEDGLLVRDLVDEAVRADPAERARIRAVALAEPALAGRLIARDGAVGGVNVTVHLPGEDEALEITTVVDFVHGLAGEVRERFPGIEVRLAGVVMFNHAFMDATRSDLKLLVPASFMAMALMLVLLVRSILATMATMLVVAMSVMAAVGLGGWIGLPVTTPTGGAPIIVLTVAIANCVHILVTLRHSMQAGSSRMIADRGPDPLPGYAGVSPATGSSRVLADGGSDPPLRRPAPGELRRDAIVESLRVNLHPVFLASLTTALGFLSMHFSDTPPLRHLGTFVAFGVGAAFVLSVTFLPALLSLLPLRAPPTGHRHDPGMTKLAELVIRHRKRLLWGSVAVVVVLVASIPRNELSEVLLHYFHDRVEFRRDADFITEHLTGLSAVEYSLASGEPGGITEPAFLSDVAKFAEWYAAQPEALHVSAVTDTFRRLNRSLHGDDPSEYRLPASRELAAQYLLLYELSLPYGLDLNHRIDVDKSATRMTVATKTLSSNEILMLDRRAQAWLADHAPHIARAESSGATLMFAYLGRRNIVSMLIGTTLALVGISLLLIVALRSLRLGLASLVPNLVPGALGFGIWGLVVGEVGLSLSVVTAMTLGIVIDDTVHFLSKYQRARRELGRSPPDAVRTAFRTAGRALLTTSLVLVAGFAVLSFSSFELNAGMGQLTALIIALALLADFFLLPPLLMKVEGDAGGDTGADRSAGDRVPTASTH